MGLKDAWSVPCAILSYANQPEVAKFVESETDESMNTFRKRDLWAITISLVLGTMLVMTSCSSPSLPKGAVGNLGEYNYSPSIIQTGDIRQIWWCSRGVNPNLASQDTDSIFYESINMSTLNSYGPVLVLASTPGGWDSAYTCNPKVIRGVFQNPLGDGQNYTYAMYYVGTTEPDGADNSIGAAFSNDGVVWKKYPEPVIPSSTQTGYGVGQPVVYNADQKAAIHLFYEDTNPTEHHVSTISIDGLHFTAQGSLTTAGLDPDNPQPSWGDMSYDLKTGEWYAVFNRPLRPVSTTGGVAEWGGYGTELYKIPQGALLTGSSPWQQLIATDTNSTGFESNFIAGFVRDGYGNLDGSSYPSIQMYTSTSYPQPSWQATPAEAGRSAAIETWILVPTEWVPVVGTTIPFNRYFNGSVHEVTTGWTSPTGRFQLQNVLGHLYAHPLNGATLSLYGCKRGARDYFVSVDVGCEGQRILGKEGYGYSQPVSGLNLVALYRCSVGQAPFQDHFVSKDPKCEGNATDELLGYVLP
jgi:hypothetical protein